VVNNPELEKFARKIINALSWRGPCELEIIKGKDGKFYLIEINPRFPAWVRLAEGSGQNQPAATVLLALGKSIEPLTAYRPGTLFVRHAEDLISDISLMGELSVNGELINTEDQ
jgi:carbamoyl-phosphate synthase large subunit